MLCIRASTHGQVQRTRAGTGEQVLSTRINTTGTNGQISNTNEQVLCTHASTSGQVPGTLAGTIGQLLGTNGHISSTNEHILCTRASTS